MDRRRFLTLFTMATIGVVAAPAIPAARVWSFPSLLEKLFRWRQTDAGVFEPVHEFVVTGLRNDFIDIEWITRETLEQLRENLSFAKIAAVQDTWDRQPLRLGTTVNVRIPHAFAIGDRPIPRLSFPATPIYPRKRAYFR